MSYNNLIKKSKGEALSCSPMTPNQEHNYIMLCLARNPLFVEVLEIARDNLKKELEKAKQEAQICFASASGDASWNLVRGPEAEIHAYVVGSKIELLNYLLNDSDNMPINIDFSDILSILANEVKK